MNLLHIATQTEDIANIRNLYCAYKKIYIRILFLYRNVKHPEMSLVI